jgi:putative ABC transport system ATP-binding protein
MVGGRQTARTRSDETRRPVVVRCSGLSHVYGRSTSWFSRGADQGVRALDDVNLELEAGEIVCVAGPSGSGKSTLLHLVAGLDTPTEGRIELCGTAISGASKRRRTRLRREHLGFVFQRFYLLPSQSARTTVALPLIELGYPGRARRERADELLERVGLGDRVTDRPGQLSGGGQQRVAVARALATDPDVLLADEPTGELDAETGRDVLSCLHGEADERDRTVLLASHDEPALRVADRVLRLNDGHVEWRHG